jgi:hypothetical protein
LAAATFYLNRKSTENCKSPVVVCGRAFPPTVLFLDQALQ